VEIAVLVKGVPRSEEIRYDPVRRTVERAGAELVLNPFDQRALRAATELRGPADRITAVALGPPTVRALLREARAVGVDRAVHLCGDAFAGSDLLATSAALASALRTLSPALVLAGARSTDSDTGLLAPEVAARLAVPVVTHARAVRVVEGVVRAEVDTEGGAATVTVALPAVVTVGEKFGKPLPVSEEAFARVGESALVTLGVEALELSPAEVGAFGSPTVVEGVRPAAPARRGLRCEHGSASERVEEALRALGAILGRSPPPPARLAWPPAYDPSREIVVLVTDRAGRLDPGALGAVSFLRRALPAHSLAVARYGGPTDHAAAAALEGAGARAGYELVVGAAAFDSADVADGLWELLSARPKLEAVVCLATNFGREVAGQLAARRSLAAVADAVAVEATPEFGLLWSKPSFGGSTVAAIRSRSVPVVVTVPRGLSAPATDGRGDEPFAWRPLAAAAPRGRVRCVGERAEPADGPEPDGAEVVVAVGSGVGGAEGIAALAPSLERWGASLVATRRVVDAGLVPVRRQVGLTGRLLAPRLAVLLGVRGASNHMIGWARAGAVLAVNRDPEAPVFAGADVGIVGSVEEVVPRLVEPLARLLAQAPA